jgi:hypothetical protein
VAFVDLPPQLSFSAGCPRETTLGRGNSVARRKEHVDLDLFAHLLKVFADTPWLHYGLWLEYRTPKLFAANNTYRFMLLVKAH